MKYFIHIGLALVLVFAAATVWADGNAILLAPRTFAEYFTDDLLEDTTESGNGESCSELGCARSYGWGKGYVTHARVGFAVREGNYTRMPQAKPPAPAPLPPSIKPTQVVAGHFRTNLNGAPPDVPQDMIALTASSGGCHLHYMMNKGPDASGENHLGWNVGVLVPSNTWTSGHFVSGQGNGVDNWWTDAEGQDGAGDGINDSTADCQADEANDFEADNQYGTALFAGDFDSDGWMDVLYLRSADRNRAGLLDLAYVFWNTGALNAQGVPVFTRSKLGSNTALYEKGVAWHLSADIGEVVDMDDDGRSDLVLGSSLGASHRILLFRQQGSANRNDPFRSGEVIIVDQSIGPAADSANPARTNFGCLDNDGPTRGITALTVADFSGDGEKDIIFGTISERYIRYYFKTGPANTAYESTSIVNPRGGVTGLHNGNWNLEGGEDILLTRSGLGCNGDLYPEANLWLLESREAELERDRFQLDPVPLAAMSNHIHYAAPLDLDHDEDGYLDFMMGTNRSWGSYYYYVHNIWKGLYNADAVIMSKRMDDLDTREEAIVRATFSGVTAENYDPTTMDVDFYLSNNGQDWDLLPLDELPPTVGGTGPSPHVFTTFGTDLRWAIVSKPQAVATVGDDENAALNQADKVAKNVPKFSGVQIAVNGVGPEFYSRSGLSQNLGTDQRVIYSAAFRYPGNEGFLRAYDLTDVAVGQSQSGVNPGPNPHLSLMWEAGALLKDRASTSRRILTYEVDDSGSVGALIELSEGTPQLSDLTGITETEEAVSLFQFVRDGLEHPDGWKFYDVGHSSPVYVGAPTSPADYGAYSVNNYQAFKEAKVNRSGVVYIGSNGGGLHAFDAETGHEKWMFIPNNLMSKLKDLRDDDNNYRADYIMDGPIVVQDIYQESLGQWRTVLMAGQAKGAGGDGFNYYFALDITDPGTDPIPLWEYSDTTDHQGESCSGNPQYETEECQPGACDDDCSQDGRVYAQQTSVTYGDPVVLEAGYADVLVDMTAVTGNNSRLSVEPGADGCPEPSPTQSLQNVSASGCPLAQYKFNIGSASDEFYVFMNVRNTEDTGANLLWYSINNDEGYARVNEMVTVPAGSGTGWQWVKSLNQPVLGSGNHDLTIWAMSDKLEIKQIVITRDSSLSPASFEAANLSAQCLEICQPQVCQTVTKVVADPANMEWPECGIGKELKCCSYAANPTTYLEGGSFCRPMAEDCADSVPDAAMGETWSEPAIGRVLLNNQAQWVVFFASGYSNLENSNVGRTIYALDAYTGAKLKDWTLKEEAPALGEGSAEIPEINIENALSASPMLVDLSTEGQPGYGYVDRLYIGDLEGRVWKIAMDVNSRGNIDQWKRCVFFDAGDYDGDGLRNWAPIITRPQVAIIESGKPHVYFGTGGDDRAPNDVRYRFYGVQDEELPGICAAEVDLTNAKNATDMEFGNTGNFEWIMGDGFKNAEWPLQPVANASEEGDSGDRYWSDPLIVDNELIYFASLAGKIESVDPTVNIEGGDSKIYCVAIRNSSELNLKAGESCWTSGSVFERESVKIRKAMMVQGIAQEAWARDPDLTSKTDEANIFYQRFSESDTPPPTLVHQGTGRSGLIKILRWREVPL